MRPIILGLRLALLGAAATGLAACDTQPVPYISRASFQGGPSEAAFALRFQAGTVDLASGELIRIRDILAGLELRDGDDIYVRIGETGSAPRDAGRAQTAASAVAGTPARVRVIASAATPLGAGRTDVAVVEVIRYGRLRVVCPTPAIDSWERDMLAVDPPVACANALNLAEMAQPRRDLIEPRQLRGSDGVASAAAVKRYDEGKVTPIRPLDSTQ